MFLILVLLLICAVLVLAYKNTNKDYWKKRNVVEVGDLVKRFAAGNRALAEVYKEIYDNHPEELYVGAFLGTKPTLILRDLQNIQAVLSSDFESFYSRGILVNKGDVLSDNVLFMGDYNRWKLIRQKLTPVFTSAKLKHMCYIIEKTARDFVEMVKENNEMKETPFKALYTYTTASIGASVFGIDTQLKNTMDSPFLEMSWKTVTPSLRTNFRFFISNWSPFLFKLFNVKIFGEYEEFFVGVVKKVLNVRRSEKTTNHNFMDMCLELQKAGTMKDLASGYELEPTDEFMAAQAFFFFIAGADTSANTMHFTLLELASNPDVLKKLHEEIDKVFTENNDTFTYDTLEKLVYLDMVINEAVRKYPPIGSVQRECTKDTVLPVGNLQMKKGTVAVVPIYAVQRDEKYFPNPDVFDPERFAPENVAQIPKFAHLPFGEGKRICLGARFANLQVKAGLAFLLRSYTLRPQTYAPKNFEKSFFSLRDVDANYELVLRNIAK